MKATNLAGPRSIASEASAARLPTENSRENFRAFRVAMGNKVSNGGECAVSGYLELQQRGVKPSKVDNG
jgi:hypothetical protein